MTLDLFYHYLITQPRICYVIREYCRHLFLLRVIHILIINLAINTRESKYIYKGALYLIFCFQIFVIYLLFPRGEKKIEIWELYIINICNSNKIKADRIINILVV